MLGLFVAAAEAEAGRLKDDYVSTEHLLLALAAESGRSAAVPAARCAAYKHHIEVMKNASAIFSRCTTEPDRTQNISQMDGTIADIKDTLKAEKCQ